MFVDIYSCVSLSFVFRPFFYMSCVRGMHTKFSRVLGIWTGSGLYAPIQYLCSDSFRLQLMHSARRARLPTATVTMRRYWWWNYGCSINNQRAFQRLRFVIGLKTIRAIHFVLVFLFHFAYCTMQQKWDEMEFLMLHAWSLFTLLLFQFNLWHIEWCTHVKRGKYSKREETIQFHNLHK